MTTTAPAPQPQASYIVHPPSLGNQFLSSSFARSYNARTGGCNIQLAAHLLSSITPYLPPPSSTSTHSPLRILDSACGPLILSNACLTSATLSPYPSLHISATDLSPAFIDHNRDVIASTPDWNDDEGKKRIDTAVMDGLELQFEDNTFDVAFTSLAIFAYKDPVQGVRELHRTLKPGGVAALTTWKRVGWMPVLHEVERLLRPEQPLTRFPFLEPWAVEGKLAGTMREGELRDVREEEVVGWALWEGEAEAARWVSETLGVMVGGSWKEEEKEGMREGFERVMRGGGEGVVRKEGGMVGFEMRAWVGVGRK